MMVLEILPEAEIEWLWTIDLSWVWFELHRYRRWKSAILLTGRSEALEAALAKTNPAALQLGVTSSIQAAARLESAKLQANPDDLGLNARLQGLGYDPDAINATAFVLNVGSLTMVERFLTSARQQVVAIMREVKLHREFAQRAERARQLFLVQDNATKVAAMVAPEKPVEEIKPS
jgi:hypothetical protein